MGLEKDLPPGEKLVACFRPFLEYLAASDLSPKTIQKHVDNMWALGGEFIRDLNDNKRGESAPPDGPPAPKLRHCDPFNRRCMQVTRW
jgi:hypothetical protein